MPLAVHRTLRQRFGHGQRQGRILEPRHLNRLGESSGRERGKKAADLVVVLARRRLQIGESGEVLGRGDGERGAPVSEHPAERSLHEIDVVQARAQRRVCSGRRMRPDRAPVLGVGPFLMSVQIAQQWIHAARL